MLIILKQQLNKKREIKAFSLHPVLVRVHMKKLPELNLKMVWISN